MNEILNRIVNTKTNKESDMNSLKNYLDGKQQSLRNRAQHELSRLVNEVNLEKNTLGYVYILYVNFFYLKCFRYIKAICSKLDTQNYLMFCEKLLHKLNSVHTRYVSYEFGVCCHKYTEILLEKKQYYRGIQWLRNGLLRFRPGKDFLTPLHSDLCCLCLKAKLYSFGYGCFCVDKIFDVNPEKTGSTPRDMLLYFYYGGMLCIGLKRFEQALEFFEKGLTVPTLAFNAIMIEIFKKNVLVQLLIEGKFLGITKNASHIVHRHMKTYCNEYIEFSKAFSSNDFKKLQNVYKDHRKDFGKDKNEGLIKQCIEAFHKRNIKKLTGTYVTISLNDIAKSVNLDSPKLVEKYLLSMIEKREISARINQENGMVSFDDDDEVDVDNTNMLVNKIDRNVNLTKRIQKMDRNISSSLTYIARMHGIRDQDAFEMQQRYRPAGLFGSMVKGVGKMFSLY